MRGDVETEILYGGQCERAGVKRQRERNVGLGLGLGFQSLLRCQRERLYIFVQISDSD